MSIIISGLVVWSIVSAVWLVILSITKADAGDTKDRLENHYAFMGSLEKRIETKSKQKRLWYGDMADLFVWGYSLELDNKWIVNDKKGILVEDLVARIADHLNLEYRETVKQGGVFEKEKPKKKRK